MERKRLLKLLAAMVWYVGAAVLLIKGSSLLYDAAVMGDALPVALAAAAALGAGVLKNRYIFTKSCEKNLRRIDGLTRPRIWEFFRLRFFLFLGAMIALGAWLSRTAKGDYWLSLAVGGLDLSLFVALTLSGRLFWQRAL